ncbi:MAG TPA: protein kinase [Thermoanaerobaculia bacterium]|nr:protein kinase [Thermoanaerobaculia bacterium]
MQLKVGDRLGQYEILGHLGAGGMGEVYRAHDSKLGRVIALKILPAELTANPEALRRFEQEARAASALNHPNIVTIYDVGHTDSIAWIAMELIDGTDLRAMASKDPLTIKNALRIGVKIADGLAAAHDRGIVHRDLKPDNVMVTVEGFVKILDFGLAKQMRALTSDDTTVPHTSPGAVFGTVGYMSPEQAMGKEMDYRSDQFSLGVMLYEMLTRVRPFDRETKPETMAAIIRAEIDPPSAHNDAIAHDLDRIVMRCLAKNPRERYASTRDLARDLREIRDGLTQSTMRNYGGRASVRPAPASRGLKPALRWSVALFALVVLTGAGFMWVRRDRAAAGQRVTSLAVVPFRDLSATPEGRILADGISELIAARLAEVRDLRVSSPFEGARVAESDEPRDVAKRRGVHAVVRGTVQRGGNDVRVTYALIDAASGRTLVSSTATRPATELFALEDSVADDLVRALGRETTKRSEPATAALGPEDQRRFVEAVGLLQRVRDEKSVDRAITTLESILRNARESGSVNALLARALLYKASLARRPALIEQATVYATRGVALSANDPESYITLGRLQNAARRHREAVASFERALALRADDPHAIVGLADAYNGLGRAADADALYRKAIALRPDVSGLYSRYGAFCFGQARYGDAVTHFGKAAELTPDFSHAHSDLGAALQAAGRYDEALAAYERSLAIEPTPAGWSNLGSLQFSLGRYDDARRSFEHAARLAPSDYLMWANLGDACFAAKAPCASGAWSRSIAAARDALQASPNDDFMRAIYATCLAKNGMLDDAQREIRRALEGDPTNPVVLYQAAVVGAQRGAAEVALSWLERAVAAGYPAADAERDPALAPLREHPSFRNTLKSSV